MPISDSDCDAILEGKPSLSMIPWSDLSGCHVGIRADVLRRLLVLLSSFCKSGIIGGADPPGHTPRSDIGVKISPFPRQRAFGLGDLTSFRPLTFCRNSRRSTMW